MPNARCLVPCSVFLFLLCARAVGQPAPVEVGTSVQLFLDDLLLQSHSKLDLRPHSPQRREVVFEFDAPWEGPQSAYIGVLQDGNQFRMYYRGGGDQTEEYACMAQSADGIHWQRPNLGLYKYKGSANNNIIYKPREKAYREAHNFAAFIDANPAARPGQRYKAVGLGRTYDAAGNATRTLNALASPDGIHWTRLQEAPVMTEGSFDSLNTVFWDTQLQKYVCYLRSGREGKRAIQRSTSDDFLHWSKPLWLEYGQAPLEQFYTNGIWPYFRNPGIYIGLPMRFVPQRKTIGADHHAIDGLSDAVLISSHDGLNFQRTFMEAYIRPGPDPLNWGNAHGNNTPAWGVLPTSRGEISIYWAEHYGQTPRLVRGTIRTDGFASLHAHYDRGEAVTKPLRFQGRRLVLNYATSAIGSIRVELQEGSGHPLPGFSLDDCDPIYGDELSRQVTWHSRADLSSLAGKTIRLRLALQDADLYSFCFTP